MAVQAVALKELLEPVSRAEPVKPSETYRLLGAHWYAKGLYRKATRPGSAIKASRLYLVREGDFVYNRLFAWMGSFAVASAGENDCYVSNEFMCYSVDDSRLDVQYLWWFFRLRATWQIALGLSSGTTPTSRNRLKEDKFLEIRLPLPPVKQQRALVSRLQLVSDRFAAGASLRDQATALASALAASWRDELFRGLADSVVLGSVAKVVDPNPSHRYPAYVDNGVPMITTSDFIGADLIDTRRAKRVPSTFWDDTLGRAGVSAGDVVFARKGKIGYARPYPPGGPLAMTHTLCVVVPDRDRLDPGYLLHFARTHAFIEYLTRTMNPNLGVPTLGLDVIRNAPIPLPDLAVQERIAAAAAVVEERLAQLRLLQVASEQMLNSLVSAATEAEFLALAS